MLGMYLEREGILSPAWSKDQASLVTVLEPVLFFTTHIQGAIYCGVWHKKKISLDTKTFK